MKHYLFTLAASLQLASLPAAEPAGWEIEGDLGVSLTRGNADTLRNTFGIEMSRESALWDLSFAADAIYGEDNGVTTNERFQTSFSADRSLSERSYLGFDTDFLYDALADLDYRSGNYLTYGYKIYDREDLELSVEAGPGFLLESRGGRDFTAAGYRIAQELDWQWTPRTKLFQSLELSGNLENQEESLLQLEAGVESSLGGPWSVRLVGTAIRYGRAAGPTGRDDLLVTFGLGYDFDLDDDDAPTIDDAQDVKEFVDDGWITTALVGGSFARGNSESSALSVGVLTKQLKGRREISLGLTANHAENNGNTSARNLFFDGHSQWDLSERSFAGFRVDFDYDELADLDYRVALSPYAGYKLVDHEKAEVTVEAGPAAIFQSKGGENVDFLAAYGAIKAEYFITPQSRLFSEVGALGDVDGFDQYLLFTTVGFEHELAESINLEIVLRNLYDSNPAAGRESNDLSLVSGIEFEL